MTNNKNNNEQINEEKTKKNKRVPTVRYFSPYFELFNSLNDWEIRTCYCCCCQRFVSLSLYRIGSDWTNIGPRKTWTDSIINLFVWQLTSNNHPWDSLTRPNRFCSVDWTPFLRRCWNENISVISSSIRSERKRQRRNPMEIFLLRWRDRITRVCADRSVRVRVFLHCYRSIGRARHSLYHRNVLFI